MQTWQEFNIAYQEEMIMGNSPILNRSERKYLYNHLVKKEFEVNPFNLLVDMPQAYTTSTYSLAPTPVECTTTEKACWLSKKKKDANPMSAYATATMIAAPADPDALKRSRLDYRLNDIYSTKKAELQKKFGLVDDDAPKTAKELDERIKAGKFIIKGLDDEKPRGWYEWYNALRWRDPAVKEDRDGYEAAKKDLKKAFIETQDIITIKDPEAGLEAMKAFEAL